MTENSAEFCPHDLIAAAIDEMRNGDEKGLAKIDALLLDYGWDPRLHFLRGSVLAALRRIDEAHEAMHRAIVLAPDFSIARYQLGFLEFTSGNADAAGLTWEPLSLLAEDNALRLFATGLQHLARDEFQQAQELLNQGLTRNDDNPAVSRDIRLILDNIPASHDAGEDNGEPMSAANFLLQQHAAKTTKH